MCTERCVGGYAVVAMITGYGIVGFRDLTVSARSSSVSAIPMKVWNT